MAVTSYVWSRLEQEKDFLERYFYGEKFPILEIHGEQCFEREVKFDNGHVYRLRVCITEGYPEKMPDLVVCESSEPMPNWTGSHTTHTWQPKDGLLRICYFHPWCWTRDIQIFRIFNKGEEWLKAYEKYLISGKPLSDYLNDMKPNEEDIKRKKEEIIQGVTANFRALGMSENHAKVVAELNFELLCSLFRSLSFNNAGSDIEESMRLTFMPFLPIKLSASDTK